MDIGRLINSLERCGRIFPIMVSQVSDAEARWKPADGAWSILEIMRHVLDEEIEDFRPRIASTLADPLTAWPAIDPPGWAIARRYNEADLGATVERFKVERADSLAWLRGLVDPQWSNAHPHPSIGSLSAGELLVAWTAHDALHLRQLAKRMFQLAEDAGGDFSARYAGGWTL